MTRSKRGAWTSISHKCTRIPVPRSSFKIHRKRVLTEEESKRVLTQKYSHSQMALSAYSGEPKDLVQQSIEIMQQKLTMQVKEMGWSIDWYRQFIHSYVDHDNDNLFVYVVAVPKELVDKYSQEQQW